MRRLWNAIIARVTTPSLKRELVAALRADRAASAETQRAFVAALGEVAKAQGAQAQVFQEYLRLVTQSAQPVVRIMDDAQEAVSEALRKSRVPSAQRQVADLLHDVNPDQLADILRDMHAEVLT